MDSRPFRLVGLYSFGVSGFGALWIGSLAAALMAKPTKADVAVDQALLRVQIL